MTVLGPSHPYHDFTKGEVGPSRVPFVQSIPHMGGCRVDDLDVCQITWQRRARERSKSERVVTIHVPRAFFLPWVTSYGTVYRGMLPGTGDDHRV